MIPVVWWTANPESIARGYWDQGVLEAIFDRSLWRPPAPLEFEHHVVEDIAPLWFSSWAIEDHGPLSAQGGVFVVPGGHNSGDAAMERLVSLLESLRWWLLIVTGDEERSFPLERLPLRGGAVWTTGARPGQNFPIDEVLGFGLQPAVLAALREQEVQPALRWDASFIGQVTHERRAELVAAMSSMPEAFLLTTKMFGGTASPDGEGLSPLAYAEVLSRSWVAPAPSGPVIPDSFRLFEALEAGALPIADSRTPLGNEPDYWTQVCDGHPPFPVVDNWERLPALVEEAHAGWPANVNRAGSWWQQRKRTLALELDQTVRHLAGLEAPDEDEITVVITTSPSPVNPSTDDIWQVVESARAQLPNAEILIAADGVRPEQAGGRERTYEEYLRALIWRAGHAHNVCVLRYGEWRHQALTLADALLEVETPLVLLLEHDTPLVGPPILWDACADALHSGTADLWRFHHESRVLEPHEHLMIGPPVSVESVRAQPTVQWSQRPHLVRTLWYRQMLATYFGAESRTMVEDVMHGVVDYHWRTFGQAGWEQFRLWLYSEEDGIGSIQRSTHLDSRGDDPKFDMLYAYDTERPAGAPRESRLR